MSGTTIKRRNGSATDVKAAEKVVRERLPFFLRTYTALSNIFDHRYRGARIPADERAKALTALPGICGQIGITPPPFDLLGDFMAGHGRYALCKDMKCSPGQVGAVCVSTCFYLSCSISRVLRMGAML